MDAIRPYEQKDKERVRQICLKNADCLYAPEETKEALSLDELRAKLGDAKKSIDNFEAESALEILKPLAAHSFADPAVGDALQKIIDALEGFDTFTAEEELNAIMERLEK